MGDFCIVPLLHSVSDIIFLPMINPLYFYSSTSSSMCALPNMAVCSSFLISCCPVMFLLIPFVPIITGIRFFVLLLLNWYFFIFDACILVASCCSCNWLKECSYSKQINLNFSIIFVPLLCNCALSLYFCFVYSSVYLATGSFFHKLN